MTRSNKAVAAYLMGVFLSGIVVGAFGHRLYTVKAVADTTRPQMPLSPEEYRRKYVEELRTRLELQPAQLTSLHGILDEARDRYRAVKDKCRPEMRQIHDEQVERIRAILEDRQKPAYEQFLAERERKRRELERRQ